MYSTILLKQCKNKSKAPHASFNIFILFSFISVSVSVNSPNSWKSAEDTAMVISINSSVSAMSILIMWSAVVSLLRLSRYLCVGSMNDCSVTSPASRFLEHLWVFYSFQIVLWHNLWYFHVTPNISVFISAISVFLKTHQYFHNRKTERFQFIVTIFVSYVVDTRIANWPTYFFLFVMLYQRPFQGLFFERLIFLQESFVFKPAQNFTVTKTPLASNFF